MVVARAAEVYALRAQVGKYKALMRKWEARAKDARDENQALREELASARDVFISKSALVGTILALQEENRSLSEAFETLKDEVP